MNARPSKATFETFEQALVSSKEEIADLLPSTITWERMRNTVIAAVKSNPDLLTVEQRYLKKSITQAAYDGLMPDGKEGVIIIQNEKIKTSSGEDEMENGKPKWLRTCRWQPMLYGIRKRARELSGMIIDAKVVYKNDFFEWEEGDNPYIHHKPVALDQDTGPLIGVYAHFRMGDEILHREVMRKSQVMSVKAISKQPNGLMWTKFEEEAWKKSAVRRGIKTVPCHPQLETVIRRFDDMHDITPDNTSPLDEDASVAALSAPAAPEASRPIAVRGKRPPPPPPPAEAQVEEAEQVSDANSKALLLAELATCKTADSILIFQSANSGQIIGLSTEDREKIIDEIEKARAKFGGK